MRLTREQLKEKFPSWNENRNDIVKTLYGDIPLYHYDKYCYEDFLSIEDETKARAERAEAFVYAQSGQYDLYKTLNGEILISTTGKVLSGSFDVKYKRKTFTITLNQMFDYKRLDVLSVDKKHNLIGYSSFLGVGKKLDKDVIMQILNTDITDYGYGVQQFIEAAKNLYGKFMSKEMINEEKHLEKTLFQLKKLSLQ